MNRLMVVGVGILVMLFGINLISVVCDIFIWLLLLNVIFVINVVGLLGFIMFEVLILVIWKWFIGLMKVNRLFVS